MAQARNAREEARQLLTQGIDPSLHHKSQKLQRSAIQENSFQAVAGHWYEQWRIGKAESTALVKWGRLENDVFPSIGPLPIGDITPIMLVTIAKAVNARGAWDVAKRVLNVCSQVFRYAIAHGIANRNPAIEIRPADILPHRVVKNRARVSEAQLPDLLQVIYGYRGYGDWMTSYYGLQLLALGDGDSLALAGSLSPKAWTDKATGEPRAGLDMQVHQVLSIYQLQKKCQQAQE